MAKPSEFNAEIVMHHSDDNSETGERFEVKAFRGFCTDEFFVDVRTFYRGSHEMIAADAMELGKALIRAAECAAGTDAADSFFPPF